MPSEGSEDWLAVLEGVGLTADGEPVEATRSLRTLELRETGQTRAMPDGPMEYGGSDHFALDIHQYLGPVARARGGCRVCRRVLVLPCEDLLTSAVLIHIFLHLFEKS